MESTDREDEPGEAARFHGAKRMPDAGGVPVERYLGAADHNRRMRTYSSASRQFLTAGKGRRDVTLGGWQELGPGNVGGRTRALVIHPTEPAIMYAAGVAGGVFKTTNGGESWTPLNDLLPNLAVCALAMDPKNPDILYAGTGEGFGNADSMRGAGIFKTEDGGQNWRRLPLPRTAEPSFYYVNKIVISFVDSSRVYAATADGVWSTIDGGVTWTRGLTRVAPENGCQDLAIRTDQPTDYLFAACGRSTRQAVIFRNTDAGSGGEWQPVFTEPNMSRTTLAIAPSNQAVIYAMSASGEAGDRRDALLAVYRSTAGGEIGTWEARVRGSDENRLATGLLSHPDSYFADICSAGRQDFINQGWYDNALAVDPMDSERVWAGGIELFRSEDGGVTWGRATYWSIRGIPQYSHADHHAIVFHPQYDGSGNQIVFDANDGGVFRSDNSRAEVPTTAQAACTPAPSRVEWKALNRGYGVTQFYHGQPYPGGHLYFGGTQDNGTILGDDVHGTNDWVRVVGGDGGYVAVDPVNANNIYAETTRLSLRRSVDGGNTFLTATRGITEPSANFLFITPYAMDPNDSQRLWIGGRSLWRTADGAQNWERASAATETGSFSAVAVAPGDSRRVLAGSNAGFIYRHADALGTGAETDWASVRPRTGNVSWIAFDPGNPDVAYATYSTFNAAGQAGHVFRSTDGGATWSAIDGSGDSGIPDIPVHSILVDPDNRQTLYLGTDLGVYVSIDGGTTWSKEDTGFPNTVVESLAIDRSGGGSTLYAFTHGRGVWRVRLGGIPACTYEVTPGEVALRAFGGMDGEIQVATAEGCTWSAVGDVGWLVPNPANGSGNGTVRMRIAQNASRERLGGIVVAGTQVILRQSGPETVAGNDDVNRPYSIAGLPFAGITDNRTATTALSDPRHSCTNSADAKTVWLRFNAPADGMVDVRGSGPRTGTVLTAYPLGASGIGAELACARGLTPEIRVPVTNGQSYLIQVSGEGALNAGAPVLVTVGPVQ